MKKITVWALGLMACAAALFAPAASAQRGEKTLGIMGGIATYNNGGFTDVYFQYNIADHVRIAPDLGYVFRNDHKSAFVLDVDVDFPFRVARGFSVYPLVGFCFNNWTHQGHDGISRAGANFGGGFDVYLTSNLKLTFQGKYSLMNDTSGGFLGMGIGYVF